MLLLVFPFSPFGLMRFRFSAGVSICILVFRAKWNLVNHQVRPGKDHVK